MSLSNDQRSAVKKVFEPIALAMGRLGLTPDALTIIGFAITVAGAALLGLGYWLIGGIVMFAGGVFDMFDGTLARATGQVSKLGAFMDSVFDRWGEAIVYAGVVAGCLGAGFDAGVVLAALAMGAAFLVSYARAKAEGLGFSSGTGMAEVGLMPREIRLVVLTAGILVGGWLGVGPSFEGGSLVLGLALAVIAALGSVTVLQRIVATRRQAGRTTS